MEKKQKTSTQTWCSDTSVQNHNTIDSQWRRTGTYCNCSDSLRRDSLLKSGPINTSEHDVIWTVGDRLRLKNIPIIDTNFREESHLKTSQANLIDAEFVLDNSKMTLERESKDSSDDGYSIAERTLAFAKLQEAGLAASVALREAENAREQALQARKEALAARRESVQAQKEAMRAKSEALSIRRETTEAKRTLTQATRAIRAILEEVQQTHTQMLEKIQDKRTIYDLPKIYSTADKIDMQMETEKGVGIARKINNPLCDKDSQRRDTNTPDPLSLSTIRSKLPIVVEPRVIITNSQKMRTLPKNISGSSHDEVPQKDFTPAFTKVSRSQKKADVGAGFDINDSCKTMRLEKRFKLPGTGGVLVDVKQNVVDPIELFREESQRIGDSDSISNAVVDESDDDLPEAETDMRKDTAQTPTQGSFIQKWGDFIGRISTLMITIVTAVNTGEALIDSIFAGSYVKAGTFAFLLVCIHLPVAAVMIWLLLKEKVQQVKDLIGKARSFVPFLVRAAKRIVDKTKNHGSLVIEEVGETNEDNEEVTEPRGDSGSVFVVGTQRSRGVDNEAFTDTTHDLSRLT